MRRTSKDLNLLSFLFIETKSWQKPKSWQTNQFLPYSQRLPREIPKNSQKNPKKITKKIPKKSQKKFKKILKKSQSIHKKFKNYQKITKILKISNSLHRTWRPKTLLGLFIPNTNPKEQTSCKDLAIKIIGFITRDFFHL